MKVKVFSDSNSDMLENRVNEFLETVSSVIDIKYACCDKFSEIMIMYNETKAAE